MAQRLRAIARPEKEQPAMEDYIGEIRLFAFNFAPKGWAACQGQLLPIRQNQPLFALLGTTYGGDGRETFGLPNLQGAVPLAQGTWCICLEGRFPPRD
jgi:microcystin-dependent protein